ncbi:hypothetical protein P154DRAFT_520719 [Amniculicola lignicola CBS 123094]|uniref:Uncharacterized protein n=1 Tax=Amniculicola lignicola CBS 123094 TaxID=1392246 RepID=A0A6A5WM83_9PLEO|nr:hypothetical protein P154DRAFT_520719 [Amniculicola lignicola CBS 123094]
MSSLARAAQAGIPPFSAPHVEVSAPPNRPHIRHSGTRLVDSQPPPPADLAPPGSTHSNFNHTL